MKHGLLVEYVVFCWYRKGLGPFSSHIFHSKTEEKPAANFSNGRLGIFRSWDPDFCWAVLFKENHRDNRSRFVGSPKGENTTAGDVLGVSHNWDQFLQICLFFDSS